ncbi:MAG: sensor histidine kinase [Planctomycetota bacterium]|jgi:signal transduction histidine kinase
MGADPGMPWWRSRLLIFSILFVGMLGMVGSLALLAIEEAGSHRATAEQVLLDHAEMGADLFISRSNGAFDRQVTYALITSLARSFTEPFPAALPLIASIAPKDDLGVRNTLSLFRYSSQEADMIFADDQRSDVEHEWLLTECEVFLSEVPEDRTNYAPELRVLHDGEQLRAFLFALPPVPEGFKPAELVGAEFDSKMLGDWLEASKALGPPLPASLAERITNESALRLRVFSPAGEPILEAEKIGYGEMISARRSMPARYGALQVEVGISPDAAASLIIGGLPAPRYPLLIGLFAGTVLLAILAFWLLFREFELTRLRSGFIASVSHELRTPLAQIRLYAETLLLGRVRNQEEAKDSLAIIDLEARRLDGLVQNVLEFSRRDRSGVRAAMRATDLASLIDEVVAGFRPLAAAQQVEIDLDLETAPSIDLDPDAFRQVLINLLDNALKYGPPGQKIRVTLLDAGDLLQVQVDDQGPGVREEDRKRIWQRYWRAPSLDPAVTGTGIGLALVRELTEQNGGRAFVVDNPEGGARFVLEFAVEGDAA